VSRNFPVIELEAVREPEVSIGARREIAHQVASACEEIGFFAVTGHGVPGAVIADLVAESYAFFDLPLAEKLAVRRPRPEQNRGYIAPGEERLARLRGDETPPDLKELYTIGPFDLPDTPYFTGPAAYPSFAPNRWPVRPVGLRPALEAYWCELGSRASCAASLRRRSTWPRISSRTRLTGTSASCASCTTRRRKPRRCPGSCEPGRTATSA
jgi:isopenicillin N synthase-like dioxygenase